MDLHSIYICYSKLDSVSLLDIAKGPVLPSVLQNINFLLRMQNEKNIAYSVFKRKWNLVLQESKL